jgi:S1-C subfamily serine protease
MEPAPSGASEERLRRLMQRAPATPSATAEAQAPEARARMLRDGEAALSRGEIEQAAAAFEQAGFVKHAADAELGLIRTYMQSGQYRRALTFAAHTAGAHPDVAAGSGLYAWLLHLGGQVQAAQQLLDRARARLPDDPLLGETLGLLKLAAPVAPDSLLQAPARFAPYSAASATLPRQVRATASGVLVDAGRRVLTLRSALDGAPTVWVRDGLGRLQQATLEPSQASSALASLKLAAPMPSAALRAAARDAFPGSPVVTVEFAPDALGGPAWPMLHLGFLGSPTADGRVRLGVNMPAGPRGGPVFDASGKLIGIAAAGAEGDQLIAVSVVRSQFAAQISVDEGPGTPSSPRIAADAIYEQALTQTVQVLRAR